MCLLPGLRRLSIFEVSGAPLQWAAVRLFLCSTLRYLFLNGNPRNIPWALLADACPHLQIMDRRHWCAYPEGRSRYPRHDMAVKPGAEPLESFLHLVDLTVYQVISWQEEARNLFVTLGLCPSLERLKLALHSSPDVRTVARVYYDLPVDSFSRLRRLHCVTSGVGPFVVAETILRSGKRHPLTILAMDEGSYDRDAFCRALKTVQERCVRGVLEELYIAGRSPLRPGDPEPAVVGKGELARLSHCPAMRSLMITGCKVNIKDSDCVDLATLWPRLVSLHLDTQSQLRMRLSFLPSLWKAFPHLEAASLPLCAALPGPGDASTLHGPLPPHTCKLRYVWVGGAHIEDSKKVAAYLAEAVPALRSIQYDVNDSSAESRRMWFLWAEVTDQLLGHCS